MQKTITINGKEYPFWLNLNSLDALKENHKIDLLGKGIEFSNTKSVVALTYECIKEGGGEVKQEELRKIMGLRDIRKVSDLVSKEISGEESGNETTPQKEG